MSCDAERVTAYVDRELPPWLERAVERHLASCPACAAQAVFEIELASTVRLLPEPRLGEGVPARVLAALTAERWLAVH